MPRTRKTAPKESNASVAWDYVKSFFAACSNATSWLFWFFAVLVVVTILFQGLAQHATVIEPISVPKALADSGYTPEVAGRRLRDAMVQYASVANTQMKNPEFALHGDLPDIVVPTVGISLDAVVTTMRTLLRITRSSSITGEFTIKDKLLWLHLRMDNRELYVSPVGVDPEKPDDLLAAAVPKILETVRPYFMAVAQHAKDPVQSLDVVSDLIDRLPESDDNVAWLYNLKGNIYRERHDDTAAAEAYNKALSLNSSLAVAHLNLGNLLKDQENLKEAAAHYREAIRRDSKFALPHYNLGLVFKSRGELDAAAVEYKKAIRLDPKFALPHFALGTMHEIENNHDNAIVEFRKSITLDPKPAQPYNSLGLVLANNGRRGEAIDNFRKALKSDPGFAEAHNNLADVLSDPAQKAAEYREAIRLNPKFGLAYRGLASVATDPKEKEMAAKQAELFMPAGADVDPSIVVAAHGLDKPIGAD